MANDNGRRAKSSKRPSVGKTLDKAGFAALVLNNYAEEVEGRRPELSKRLRSAASLVKKLAKDRPHWIAVSERLPKWGEVVLVYYDGDGGSIEAAAYIGDAAKGPWACEAAENDDLGSVTHWMPLPKPPA